jgi:hypothetical protein
LEEEKDGDQCHDPRAGIEEEISSHDTRNGSARPDGRDIGIPICEEVDQASCQTTEKIEDEISNVAESVFNIVSEDIEKPHVHNDMKESSVKEHGSQKREILLEPCKVGRKFWVVVSERNHSIEIKNFF